jgi:hypothetical protein
MCVDTLTAGDFAQRFHSLWLHLFSQLADASKSILSKRYASGTPFETKAIRTRVPGDHEPLRVLPVRARYEISDSVAVTEHHTKHCRAQPSNEAGLLLASSHYIFLGGSCSCSCSCSTTASSSARTRTTTLPTVRRDRISSKAA